MSVSIYWYSLCVSVCLSLSLSAPFSLSLSLSSLCASLFLCLFPSVSDSLSLFSVPLSFSLSLSLSLSLSHTPPSHTHTVSLSPSYTHTHTDNTTHTFFTSSVFLRHVLLAYTSHPQLDIGQDKFTHFLRYLSLGVCLPPPLLSFLHTHVCLVCLNFCVRGTPPRIWTNRNESMFKLRPIQE